MKKNNNTNNDNNVIKYPKQYHVSLGFIIIGVMFIYICYHVFTYITSKNVTVYEVTHGTISNDLEYNALALRQEEIITAPKSGSIIYLAENGDKVSVKSRVYAIDETGEILSNLTDVSLADKNIDPKELSGLSSTINNYSVDYNNNSFNKIYSFKSDLTARLGQLYSMAAMDTLGDEIGTAIDNGSFHVYNSDRPGVIIYSIDGFEDFSMEDLSSDSFDVTRLSTTNLKADLNVTEGKPIYKIITSDKWNLVLEINSNLAKELENESYIKIRFLEDNVETWASFELLEKAGKNYILLTLDDSMDRYASARYIHIKLLNSGISGLKIPISSITEKEFFTIPKEYFYGGEGSSDLGVLMEDGSNVSFKNTTVFHETDDFYYVDSSDVPDGATIIKSNSSERYKVGTQTATLKGVYNVNKGYAVFKQIEIIYKNEDYAIIKTGTSYGVSMYDHIVLQGDQVSENDIIN